MNINLDNYESFFLLYVDNELPDMQRKEVEAFLQRYPYLQPEMDALQDVVLPVQKSKFEFKASLLKPVVSDELLQENMLLHLDNELGGDQKKELEKLLLQDAHLQEDWAVLRKTKLDADDKVLFADKHLLYRRERAKIITGRFVRLAVAALFIGAGFFAGIRFFNSEGTGNIPTATLPGKNNSVTKPAIAIIKPKQQAPANIPNSGAPNVGTVDVSPVREIAQRKQTDVTALPAQRVAVAAIKQGKTNPVAIETEPTPVTEQPHSNIARLDQEVNTDISRSELIAANVKTQPTALTDIAMQPVENLFARNASISVEDEENDDHIFMIDEDKVARTKAAGFIKKIKRTVERTTKIKPGNSLRIAGFEFAVK